MTPFTISDACLRDAGKGLRGRGILYPWLPWGGADAKVYARLPDRGMMSFATDFPKATLDAVRACGGKRRGAICPSRPPRSS